VRSRVFALVLGFAAFAPSRAAHAGFVEGFDLVQVTPFVGGQVVRALGGMPASMSGSTFASGLTTGGVAAIRLWPVSLGVLVQRTEASDARELGVDRVYGQLGFNNTLGQLLVSAHFDAGYAFLHDGDKTIQGYGAKIGLTVDYFPHKLISFGGGGDFDLQAFPVERQPLISVGGTFVARVGLHL
jgi:hypothetical protein